MNIGVECYPCFIKQSLEALEMLSLDKQTQTTILKRVLHHLSTIEPQHYSPPELSREIHDIIRTLAHSDDPYAQVKDTSNTMAEHHYAQLKTLVQEAEDPLLLAIKLAIVGNVIDFGTSTRFSVEDKIHDALHRDFDATAYPRFVDALQAAHTILYLADNAGEIYFDKLLLEELHCMNKDIIYVVKANPIINDATMEDVHRARLDDLVTVIEGDKGQSISAPGISLSLASEEFKKYFTSADMVIAKGQGNFESLSQVDREIFFLLMVKCPLVADEIGIELGKLVLKVINEGKHHETRALH